MEYSGRIEVGSDDHSMVHSLIELRLSGVGNVMFVALLAVALLMVGLPSIVIVLSTTAPPLRTPHVTPDTRSLLVAGSYRNNTLVRSSGVVV
ncbi:hypothetical protein D3C73_1289400 [compost metagenome]